ncbi:unnamed protein product [Amaranthus hypochondriacus]
MAREILKPHDLIFSSRPQLYAAKKLTYNYNNISFAPYGEYWMDVRKIAVSELFSTKRVNSFRTVRSEEVNLVMDSIMRCSSTKKHVNLSELMISLSNNVVCRVAFGMKFDGNGKEILNRAQCLLGELNIADYYPWFGWVINKFNGVDGRLDRNFRDLDEFYDQVIQQHLDCVIKSEGDDQDFVDVLLQIQMNDSGQTIRLNNNQIKGILTDMFIAGTDTSASVLVWAMTELIRNPPLLEKVQQEVRQLVKGKQRVEETDIPQLKYIQLIIKETFRLHPPVPLLVPRETTSPCTIINGYKIPQKTRVLINAKAIGMDPNIWECDPNEFNPDRFMGSSIDYKGHDFELIPFGVGRRGCPGLSFGVLLIELALANLLYCFDWSLPCGITKDDVDMEEAIGITTHKNIPLLLFANPRSS